LRESQMTAPAELPSELPFELSFECVAVCCSVLQCVGVRVLSCLLSCFMSCLLRIGTCVWRHTLGQFACTLAHCLLNRVACVCVRQHTATH